MVRIKIPDSFQIKTVSGDPFNIHKPEDWNVDELVEIVFDDNKEYFSSLGIQIHPEIIKGLIINDICNQYEALKKGVQKKDNLKEAMRQKIEAIKQQRAKK
jgi:hypothetical protein